MRYGEPFDFKRVYASSNGTSVWEVTHDADKPEEDRVNPPSWIAFLKTPYVLEQLKTGTLSLEGDVTRVSSYLHVDEMGIGRRKALDSAYNMFAEVVTNSAEWLYENYDDPRAIPHTGMHQPTYEAARVAIEVGQKNVSLEELLKIHERLARDERNQKGFWNVMRKGEKHYGKLKDAIIASRDAGKLPSNIHTNVDMLGGGLQGLSIYYQKDLAEPVKDSLDSEDFWWTITDWEYPPMMGWYQVGDDGEYLYGEDGDCLISFHKPTYNKDITEDDWDLENAQCVANIVQTLEIIEAYSRANTH